MQFWDDGSGNLIAAHLMAPSESYVGKLGSNTVVATAVPVVSLTAYTGGDCFGALLTFTNVARLVGGSGIIQSAQLFCKSTQALLADLYPFHTAPTITTGFVDNAAFSVAVADFDKRLPKISFPAMEATGTPGHSQATPLGIPFVLPAGTRDLTAVLVARSAPTLLSVSDLKVSITVLQD
jgi:hypothetical protein